MEVPAHRYAEESLGGFDNLAAGLLDGRLRRVGGDDGLAAADPLLEVHHVGGGHEGFAAVRQFDFDKLAGSADDFHNVAPDGVADMTGVRLGSI